MAPSLFKFKVGKECLDFCNLHFSKSIITLLKVFIHSEITADNGNNYRCRQIHIYDFGGHNYYSINIREDYSLEVREMKSDTVVNIHEDSLVQNLTNNFRKPKISFFYNINHSVTSIIKSTSFFDGEQLDIDVSDFEIIHDTYQVRFEIQVFNPELKPQLVED